MAGIQLHENDRPALIGIDVEELRLTQQRAEPVTLSAAGGISVSQTLAWIEARPAVDADQLDRQARICRNGAQMQRTMAGMFQQIGGQLRSSERHATRIRFIETQRASHALGDPPGMANLTFVLDGHHDRRAAVEIQDHLRMLTRVPAPGELSSSNSST